VVRVILFAVAVLMMAIPAHADCASDERRIKADFRTAQSDVKRIRDGLKADRRALDRAGQGARRDLRDLRRLEQDYRGLDGQSRAQATRKARGILNDMDRLLRKLIRAEQSALRDLRSMSPDHDHITRIGSDLARKTDALKVSCPGADVTRVSGWAAKNSRDSTRSAALFARTIDEKEDRIAWSRDYADRINRERNRVR
jgi:hypothetical protein